MTEYQPGVCNIGTAEIARRRRAGHLAALATAALFAVLVVSRAPRSARLLVALPATSAASGYIQARRHFCAGFGYRGVFNFGPLGHTEAVVDPQARARDLAESRRIGVASLGVGLTAAAVAVAAPV